MMKRIFKFFDDNNLFSLNLEVPITLGTPEPNYILPPPNHYHNYINYAETDPNRNWITRPVNMLFEWANQYEYRELEVSRMLTFHNHIEDFPVWYDDLMNNLNDNEYLPIYPAIYQLRHRWGINVYSLGDITIPVTDSMVEIDVKVYLR